MSNYPRELVESLPTLRLDVLYGPDENGIIVLNKPPGLDSFNQNPHTAGYPPMSDVMKQLFPAGSAPHRIDRGTSGIHVWSLGTPTRKYLYNEWGNCTKTYLAAVDTPPVWDQIDLTMHVKNQSSGPSRPCTTRLINLGNGAVSAQLVMGGRNHQIRRALKSIKSPIPGDFIYGGTKTDAPLRIFHDRKYRPRFLLHAWRWELGDIKVQAKLPSDMEQFEPGGWTEPLASIDIPPMTWEQYSAWVAFRAERMDRALAWPYTTGQMTGESDEEAAAA